MPDALTMDVDLTPAATLGVLAGVNVTTSETLGRDQVLMTANPLPSAVIVHPLVLIELTAGLDIDRLLDELLGWHVDRACRRLDAIAPKSGGIGEGSDA